MAHKTRGTPNRTGHATFSTGSGVIKHTREKVTGDAKEEVEKPGFAKASPEVKEVTPKVHASKRDASNAVKKNTVNVKRKLEKEDESED